MEGDRFDELARTLGAGTSRRAVLRRLVGAVVGGAGATLGLGRVRAGDRESADEIRARAGERGAADAGRGGDELFDARASGDIGADATAWDFEGDSAVVVDGGDSVVTTEFTISADGGIATADASGGSGNVVKVVYESPPPPAPCPRKTCADFPAGACGPQPDGCGGLTADCGGGGSCAVGLSACGGNQSCRCVTTAQGSFCAQARFCGQVLDCASDADCPGTQRCGLGFCCGQGRPNTCVSPCGTSPQLAAASGGLWQGQN